MKRYKIPDNIREIIIKEGLVFAVKKLLVPKDKDWEIITVHELLLEEKND